MTQNGPPRGARGQRPSVPKSVFITGAGGFIGKALMDRYRALGATVRGMDLRANMKRDIVGGELTRPESWRAYAQGCELFIHTAALVSLAADWQAYRDITVRGTRLALDAALDGGAKRFVHFSSIAALGHDYPAGADEKTPVVIGEQCRYGVSKAASEHIVLAAHAAGEIECTLIRPGDVYGPGSRAWLIEPLRMAKAGKLLLPDDGSGIFTPVYIDDLLDGVLLAAGLPEGSGQIFILWGGEPVPCRDFFSYHWRWAGRQGRPRSMPLAALLQITRWIWKFNRLLGRHDEVSPDAVRMLARTGGFDMRKARDLLGYEPKVSFVEGMRRSEAWLREVGEIEGADGHAGIAPATEVEPDRRTLKQ